MLVGAKSKLVVSLHQAKMFAKFAVLAFLVCQVYSANVEFDLINNSGSQPVFIQVLGTTKVPNFVLPPKGTKNLIFPQPWSGRIWGRIDCQTDADCGAAGPIPASLFEMTIGGGNSFYDLSLVDGFNIDLSVTPVGGKPDGSAYRCKKATCAADILSLCPNELKVKNKAGTVVACNAACNVFHTDLYCCRGAHSVPEKCKSSDWPVDYAGFFKKNCPDAYSYAYDDKKSTFTCDANQYTVTFL